MLKQLSNNENRLLFFNWKRDRKTKLEINNKEQIKFSGPCSDYGLNVPAILKEWIKFPEEKIAIIRVVCDYIIFKEGQEQERFINIESKIHYKIDKWNIQPSHLEEKKRIIKRVVKNKWILQCEIRFYSKKDKQLDAKSKYYQAKNVAKVDFSIVKNSEPIITYDYKTKKVSIYQDAKGIIYVKATGRLYDYGAFHLNQYIAQYITNWLSTEEYYYAILEGREPIVVPSKLSRRKERGGRVSKKLIFPYWGKEKEAEVLFSSPTMTFTPEALIAIKAKKMLENEGVSLKGLLTNVWDNEHHKNKDFATNIKSILYKYNDKILTNLYLPETLLEFKPSIRALDHKHCFDHFQINMKHQDFSIICGETISSFSKGKNRVIDEEIALLHTFKSLLGEKCIAILFINAEVSSRLYNNVTEYYALASNILILGNKHLTQCQQQSDYFSQLIETFQAKQTLLYKSNEKMVVHPVTNIICQQQELYNEALSLLLNTLSRKRTLSKDATQITNYCKLMGIIPANFWVLLRDGQTKETRELVKSWLRQQTHLIFSSERIQAISKNDQLLDYLYIHYKLVTEQTVVFIDIKPELHSLRPYKALIKQLLPEQIKIECTLKQISAGSEFEGLIALRLEEEGYSTFRNANFSFASRTFEIDILALATDELLFISCKNHSTMEKRAEAEKFLHITANRLTFHCSICNIPTGRVYFKANPAYSETLKEQYHKTYWTDNIQLFILD
ncbi:MAG: hypothetical protein HZR80_07040 [Candidatus Heimdallarchaeota archaeon]